MRAPLDNLLPLWVPRKEYRRIRSPFPEDFPMMAANFILKLLRREPTLPRLKRKESK